MSTSTLHTPQGPVSQRPKEQRRRQRPKQTAPLWFAVGTRVLGLPVARASNAVLAANIRAQRQGTSCPCTPSSSREVLRSGERTRLQAAASAALATCNQMI